MVFLLYNFGGIDWKTTYEVSIPTSETCLLYFPLARPFCHSPLRSMLVLLSNRLASKSCAVWQTVWPDGRHAELLQWEHSLCQWLYLGQQCFQLLHVIQSPAFVARGIIAWCCTGTWSTERKLFLWMAPRLRLQAWQAHELHQDVEALPWIWNESEKVKKKQLEKS